MAFLSFKIDDCEEHKIKSYIGNYDDFTKYINYDTIKNNGGAYLHK